MSSREQALPGRLPSSGWISVNEHLAPPGTGSVLVPAYHPAPPARGLESCRRAGCRLAPFGI